MRWIVAATPIWYRSSDTGSSISAFRAATRPIICLLTVAASTNWIERGCPTLRA